MKVLEQLLNGRWLLIFLIFVLLPFTIRGAVKAWYSNANQVADWMPDDLDATRQLWQFIGLFGTDELLMISWDGCSLDDPRIALYEQALLQVSPSGQPFYREVITGPEILKFFESEPSGMSRAEALRRMRGWIVSEDGKQTCVIAVVSEHGAADRHESVCFARKCADHVPRLSAGALRMAGPTIEGVAIDQASTKNLFELNIASFVVCLVIMGLCLRSIRAALLVFLIALFNEQMSMALIYYMGSRMDSVLLLTANLTFVLTVSVGIHLVNYYRDVLRDTPASTAPAKAIYVALKPTSMATATTALGLISLTISQVKPLKRFGAFSAASIIIAAVIAMVYIAVYFRIWPLTPPTANNGRDVDPSSNGGRPSRLLVALGRSAWPIILVTVATFLGGYMGVRQLQTSVGLRELVKPSSHVIQDYKWLEQKIGPLTPVEIVVPMEKGSARLLLQQFRTITKLHHSLEQISRADIVISTVTFSPDPPPRRGGLRQLTRAAVFRRKLMESQQKLASLGFLYTDAEYVYWRLSMRVPAMQDVDYGRLLRKIGTVVDDVLPADEALRKRVLICGGVPLVYQAQGLLLRDLIKSFLLAFVLVSVTLMALFRSIMCGLICMIPNIFPSALVFGLMGWLKIPVEIGAILTASAALGIAVDDSLHFITWFRRETLAGGSVSQSVQFAYRRCAAAMVQTTLICSLGLVVFSASEFVPIVRFGWCMFSLLIIALIGDLVVLPAILLSPLGRPFQPRPTASKRVRRFAYRVAGPRGAVINIVMSVPIAMFLFAGAEQIPLMGVSSFSVLVIVLSFLIPAITTWFGYRDGVAAQRSEGDLPAVYVETHWGRRAALFGAVRGVAAAVTAASIAAVVYEVQPSLSVPNWAAVLGVGMIAGLLGYAYHATAAVRAASVGH